VKPVAVTPIAFVHAILRAYQRYGKDPAVALAQAQITPGMLQREDTRITAVQMEQISAAAMQELDDEALGWFSRRLPWGSYGMLARASLTSPTLGVALKRWCRHHALLTDDLLVRLDVRGAQASLHLEERRELGEMREFCLLSTLRNVHGYASWLIDSRIALREIGFPFRPPPHAPVYALMFPGPVYFQAAQAGFSFDARYLTLPLRRDERALRTMLQRALPLTVGPYRRDRLLVQRVRELLRTQTSSLQTADAVARALNMSVRTLHRQLQDEGASLQALKDRVRQEQAEHLLQRTARPIKQVAMAVGFASEKSFARAFRQWTGDSPSDFRAKSQPG
jgi:AraC-like DNA-binding protein